MLRAIEQTATATISLIGQIKSLMDEYEMRLKAEQFPQYQAILLNLFKHPYTKIDFIIQDLGITRLTASKYLARLVDMGILNRVKIGRSNFYINSRLFEIFANKHLHHSSL